MNNVLRNYDQLKIGAILNYVLILLNTVVGLVYIPYMLRMMGQSEYGLYSLVSSVISYLTILDLGIGNAIIRYTAKYRAEGKVKEQYELFGMFFILYLIIGIVALGTGVGLYCNVDVIFAQTMSSLELNRARLMILILVFNLAITFPMSIFSSILTAYEEFIFPRIINILRILLNTIIMVVLLHYGYRAVAMVIVQTVFNILTLIINYIYCKYNLKIQLIFNKFKWGLLKEVSVYSFWILLNVIMDKLYWSTGQFVLGAISGTIAVSVFAVAIQFQSMYMQFSTAISSVFLPKITSMVSKDCSNQELSLLFIKTGRIQYIIMCFIMCGFIVFGKPFIILWAGKEYLEAYVITVLFFVSLVIPLIQNIGITILQAKNQMKFRSILYICIASVALVFEILLSKHMGIIGCAIAISGAILLGQGVIMNVYYSKVQNINIVKFWKEIIKMSIVPFITTIAATIYVRQLNVQSWFDLFRLIIIYTIIYVPLFWFVSMNKDEKLIVKHLIKRVTHI